MKHASIPFLDVLFSLCIGHFQYITFYFVAEQLCLMVWTIKPLISASSFHSPR